MTDIVTDRLVLRPITAEDVQAVLTGRRQSGWAGDFFGPPQDGEVEIGYGLHPGPAEMRHDALHPKPARSHLPHSPPPVRFHLIQAWPDRPREMSLS